MNTDLPSPTPMLPAEAAPSSDLVTVFRAVAGRYPERIALICGERQIPYRQLLQMVAQQAAQLQAHDVGAGDRVGLYARRSPECIAAILAVLALGAAYLPFDPSYPDNLLRFQFEDSQLALLLLGEEQTGVALPFPDGRQLRLGTAVPDAAGLDLATLPPVSPEAPAYVMYTSGSTGRPKGVVVPQRGVLRLVLDNPYVDFGADEVFLQLSPLSFDASTFEIWGALLHGATLVLAPQAQPSLDDIVYLLGQHRVSTLWLTAGLFHLLVEQRLAGLAPVRQLLAGGDVLSPAHVRRLLQTLPHCRVYNGYGPTENTTFTCCYPIPASTPADAPIPIGPPIAGTEVHLFDEQGCPVPSGEIGELYVGGRGLALGYLNRPELTAERFVSLPGHSDPAARLYRTGDLVRQRPDGVLEFCGRADRQVKINGRRIELDEIENVLRRSPLVADAAVVARRLQDHERHLVAFIAPKSLAVTETETASLRRALQQFLQQELPDYMCPGLIRLLPALPLTPNGKVDRRQLEALPEPAPMTTPRGEPGPDQARSSETLLRRLWQQVLPGVAINRDDNFFDLGGTSLQLIRLHALLENELPGRLQLVDLFTYPRIASLAARLDGQAQVLPANAATAAAATVQRNAGQRAQGLQGALQRARQQKRA